MLAGRDAAINALPTDPSELPPQPTAHSPQTTCIYKALSAAFLLQPSPINKLAESTTARFSHTHGTAMETKLLKYYSSSSSSSSAVWTVAVVVAVLLHAAALRAEGRAFFVFGDSLVDNGNNNYLVTSARADGPPYGIDYPTHRATGRFSNGLNIPDLISQRIGSESTLPYLSPELTGERLLVGANFASAGIGILNDTGIQFVNIIRIYKQLEYFQQYQARLSSLVGAEEAQRVVNQGLVLMTLGGNDFVNNYYLVPFSARSRQFSLPDYVRYLISEYRKILMRVYKLGGRRVIVTGTGPLGCVPAELALRSRNGECATELQRAAGLFNPQLFQLVDSLNSEIGADVFIGADPFPSDNNFVTNPQGFGFVTSKIACCGQGPYNGLGLCTPLSNLCPNRDIYAFWDSFHPSERANGFIVDNIFNGSPQHMRPMNLSTIMALDSASRT